MITDIIREFGGMVNALATHLSGGDAGMKGIISVMILGGLGTLVAFGRKIPKKIFGFLLSRCTISVEFTNNWYGENRELFGAASDFVSSHQTKMLFKIFEASVAKTEKQLRVSYGVSVSSGIFFHRGRPVWYHLQNAQEQGAVPESVTIRTIGRTPQVIIDLIEASPKIMKHYTRRNFYTYEKDWQKVTAIPKRDLKLFMRPEVKAALDKRIDFFINHKKWFEERSINHKLLIILDGPPGTGKSAISRYVADRLNWSLGTISSGAGFEEAVRKAAASDMVVSVPDVDAIGLGAARGGVAEVPKAEKKEGEKGAPALAEKPAEPEKPESELVKALKEDGGQVARILNLFQGDLPLNNSVVVMSTNCIEKLDPALLRPSRCDLSLYIGALGAGEVHGFREHYYPDDENTLGDSISTISIRACDLMESFQNNAFDVNKFDEAIKKFVPVEA